MGWKGGGGVEGWWWGGGVVVGWRSCDLVDEEDFE